MRNIDTNVIFFIAPLMYAMSIFVDVFTYHLKFNLHDGKNYRYLFSLINVFQYSARGFVLVFVPIMAYCAESLKDKDLVWQMTLWSHILVVLFISPLYMRQFSLKMSKFVIEKLNYFLGKGIYKKNFCVTLNDGEKLKNSIRLRSDMVFFVFSFTAFLIYAFSMTFLYYITFYFPNKVLMFSSYSQILNAVGTISILLFIDPKMMALIDNGEGLKELNILIISRMCAHILLVFILIFIR